MEEKYVEYILRIQEGSEPDPDWVEDELWFQEHCPLEPYRGPGVIYDNDESECSSGY